MLANTNDNKIDILAMESFPDYPFALDSADVVYYGEDGVETAVAQHAIISNTNDRVWLVSATQKERVTAMVSFEVTLGMKIESAETAVSQLYIAHPDWENNGLIARNDLTFQPVSGGTFRLTATPDQIRLATDTDNPVLVVEVWPYVTATQATPGEPAIRETFTACPMDLTRSDEFTCTP
jgi:hypothetical protein